MLQACYCFGVILTMFSLICFALVPISCEHSYPACGGQSVSLPDAFFGDFVTTFGHLVTSHVVFSTPALPLR